VDRALDSLAQEFSLSRRQELAREASRALLGAAGAGYLPWLLQRGTVFRWPYLQGPPETPFARQHLDSHYYLDPTATGYSERPSRQVS
jgi:hypothetical protein